MEVHIGLDDTDSTKSGCTTYLAACLVEQYSKRNIEFIDYPNIIRLNPNIPWKTRGNGAVCLRIKITESIYTELKEETVAYIKENYDAREKETNPGVVFLKGKIPAEISKFSNKALYTVASLEEALSVARENQAEAVGFNNSRGIIGALAAVGENLTGDHTYEAIAYRLPENRGKPRRVDMQSVFIMDRETKPFTYNNIDYKTKRILVTPRGPDPILFGLRGESPEIVKYAMKIINAEEPIERWIIFRTNQGTDSHLAHKCEIKELKPYMSVIIDGTVSDSPKAILGGHLIFALEDETGKVTCAAYEPTGEFRNVVRQLIVGDKITVYGGLRKAQPIHLYTVNMEKLEVLELAKKIERHNPNCPLCNRVMSSMGFRKGFRCEKCGFKNPHVTKLEIELSRELTLGLHIPPARAHRHLTKPISRYGLEKKLAPKENIQPENFWGRNE